MKVEILTRKFEFNSMALADPDPSMSVEAVRDLYINAYPELNNSIIEGPTEKNGFLVYSFRKAVGTKA